MSPYISLSFILPLFLLLSPRLSWGFRFPYLVRGDQTGALEAQQTVDDPDTDLQTLLWSSPDGQSQVYTIALQVLEELKASPSCHRLAAASLIRSCQSIDGSVSNHEESLEDAKSVYAAQLALCEIMDAGSRNPEDCESFAPGHSLHFSRKSKRGLTNDHATMKALKGELRLCLQALESRPQHWTSYSNNRQNAVIMCQAARIDVEKDNLVQLHQSLVDTTSGASSALTRALAAANKALLDQKRFATEVEHFQQQLIHDLEASKAQTQSYFRNLMKNLDSALQSTIKPFTDKMKKVATEADEVQKALHSSTAKANELRSNIGRLVQEAVDDRAELATAHANTLEAISSAKALLHNDLQSMGEVQSQSMVGAFNNIHNQLRASNELVGVMYARQTDLDRQLSGLDRHLADLKDSSAALLKTHAADAEASLRLSNQVQIELQVARGLIADITTSATSLQTSLQDTGSKVAHMVALGGLTDTFLIWAWCLVALFVLYIFSARYARYVAGTLGAFALLSMSGLPDMTLLHAFARSVSPQPLYLGLLCCCVFIAIIMLYQWFPRGRRLALSTLHQVTQHGKASHEQAHHSYKV
ncbi:MAG: hypothetical protein Q9169_006389 [Polycauliona sp. 2 TL-2023]